MNQANDASGNPILQAILEATNPASEVSSLTESFLQERSKEGGEAAQLVTALAKEKPELLVPIVDKLTTGIAVSSKRIAQASALALPAVTRVAPARVAKHLDRLKVAFDEASPIGKDGLVRTFAALCTASVAYQKRLEPVLTKALHEAEPKALLKWTETVLPALKGEPHARARAVVEERLTAIPRPTAQKVADFLGVKLRPQAR